MTTSSTTNTLNTWLGYAQLGIPIVPEHTPNPNTATGCDCNYDDCIKPGKHPRTEHGSKDATTDEKKIRWWHSIWPHANVGTSLEMAGLVIIGPDSPEWHDEFKRRGLKDGPVAQSGGGEGHLHYFRRLPPGVPATRICKSGEYDILANGNAILAGSLHASGRRYEWIVPITSLDAIPYLEEWACDELRAAAAKQRTEIDRGDGDEPPVLLDDEALAVWRGERPKLTKEGNVERSGTLLKIGRVLYDAGATRRTIVTELAEIDAARYQKYTNRKDANERYHGIVDELERSGRSGSGASIELVGVPGFDGGETCRGCAERDEIIRVQRQRLGEYVDREAGQKELRTSKAWSGKQRQVVEYLAEKAHQARTEGKTEVTLYLPKDGKKSGTSAATVSAVTTRLKDLSTADLPFKIEDRPDEKSGHPRLVMTNIKPDSKPGRDIAILARIPRPESLGEHGGARRYCPDHPRANLILRKSWRCSECHKTVDRAEEHVIASPFHDETTPIPVPGSQPPVDTDRQIETGDELADRRARAAQQIPLSRATDKWKRPEARVRLDPFVEPEWLSERPDDPPDYDVPAAFR